MANEVIHLLTILKAKKWATGILSRDETFKKLIKKGGLENIQEIIKKASDLINELLNDKKGKLY